MVKFLKDLFGGPEPARPAPDQTRAAVAALLVEAARADGDYATAEQGVIDGILADHYRLSGEESAALRQEGERAQDGAADIVRFSRRVKEAVPHQERIWLIERVWEVVYADGVSDHFEENLVRRLCGLLYVSDSESGAAKRRVRARIGASDGPKDG